MFTETICLEQRQIAGNGSLVLKSAMPPPMLIPPEYLHAEHANGLTCPIFFTQTGAVTKFQKAIVGNTDVVTASQQPLQVCERRQFD